MQVSVRKTYSASQVKKKFTENRSKTRQQLLYTSFVIPKKNIYAYRLPARSRTKIPKTDEVQVASGVFSPARHVQFNLIGFDFNNGVHTTRSSLFFFLSKKRDKRCKNVVIENERGVRKNEKATANETRKRERELFHSLVFVSNVIARNEKNRIRSRPTVRLTGQRFLNCARARGFVSLYDVEEKNIIVVTWWYLLLTSFLKVF